MKLRKPSNNEDWVCRSLFGLKCVPGEQDDRDHDKCGFMRDPSPRDAEIRWYCKKHESLYALRNERVCDSNLAVSRAIGRNPFQGSNQCGKANRIAVSIVFDTAPGAESAALQMHLVDVLESAVLTDGGHHKQWYLEHIAAQLGIDLPDHEPGIAP